MGNRTRSKSFYGTGRSRILAACPVLKYPKPATGQKEKRSKKNYNFRKKIVQTLFHTTLSIIKLPLLLLLSSLGQKRHKGKLSAAGKERYQLTFHSDNPELKSVNLQYITLSCLDDGTNESSTKSLMFKVLFFFYTFYRLKTLCFYFCNFIKKK